MATTRNSPAVGKTRPHVAIPLRQSVSALQALDAASTVPQPRAVAAAVVPEVKNPGDFTKALATDALKTREGASTVAIGREKPRENASRVAISGRKIPFGASRVTIAGKKVPLGASRVAIARISGGAAPR